MTGHQPLRTKPPPLPALSSALPTLPASWGEGGPPCHLLLFPIFNAAFPRPCPERPLFSLSPLFSGQLPPLPRDFQGHPAPGGAQPRLCSGVPWTLVTNSSPQPCSFPEGATGPHLPASGPRHLCLLPDWVHRSPPPVPPPLSKAPPWTNATAPTERPGSSLAASNAAGSPLPQGLCTCCSWHPSSSASPLPVRLSLILHVSSLGTVP